MSDARRKPLPRVSSELIEWLTELRKEVIGLFHNLHLFRFTRDTVLNPNVGKGLDMTYTLWILNSAKTDMVITVGRFCDERSDSKSMVKFLQRLKKEDGSRHFKSTDIDSDISRLTSQPPCSKIIRFRNEYIAHAAKAPGARPTYDELFAAFEIIKEVMQRYQAPVIGNYTDNFTPTIQGDWQRILIRPWLVPLQKGNE